MPKRMSETVLSTSVRSELSKTKRRKTSHNTDPGDGPATIAMKKTRPWFEIPEIVEKILSYLDSPRDTARAELVNKTFQSRSWLVIEDFDFYFTDGRIYGPFIGFNDWDWLPSERLNCAWP